MSPLELSEVTVAAPRVDDENEPIEAVTVPESVIELARSSAPDVRAKLEDGAISCAAPVALVPLPINLPAASAITWFAFQEEG